MKLTELEPSFLLISEQDENTYQMVDNIAEAQGVSFLCPKCMADRGGKPPIHSIICWFDGRGVPNELHPKPGRWNPSGHGYTDLTFVGPGATSVLLAGGCQAHFHIENGEIKMC